MKMVYNSNSVRDMVWEAIEPTPNDQDNRIISCCITLVWKWTEDPSKYGIDNLQQMIIRTQDYVFDVATISSRRRAI